MNKKIKKIASILSASVICAGAVAAFAGCTTKYPTVTITYTFNNVDYAVTYTLSRYDAPKTVQHFIEVADTGFYDGMCVHNYDSNFLYTGGYTLENNTLTEKDYYSAMKAYEAESGKKLTQSVWGKGSDLMEGTPVYTTADDAMVPLYSVYGEFTENGNKTANGKEYVHSFGALVMYYTDKGQDATRVITERNDNGADNNGDKYNRDNLYKYNSATSQFYTFTGQSNTTRDGEYCVFGVADEAGKDKLQELIDAISDYKDGLSEEASFTDTVSLGANEYLQYDPVEEVRKSGMTAEYDTPVDMPILVKSVKITKY